MMQRDKYRTNPSRIYPGWSGEAEEQKFASAEDFFDFVADERKSGGCKLAILSIDDDYIVVNKPPDMKIDGGEVDGEFEDTVQSNLVRMVKPSENEWDLRSGDSLKPSKRFRLCHQLDYATSGIMLLARNKKSARLATAAFESRKTKKTYQAVVGGRVDISRMPFVDRSVFERVWGGAEGPGAIEENHKKRKKSKPPGYKPASAFFEQWKRAAEVGRNGGGGCDGDSVVDSGEFGEGSAFLQRVKWNEINNCERKDSEKKKRKKKGIENKNENENENENEREAKNIVGEQQQKWLVLAKKRFEKKAEEYNKILTKNGDGVAGDDSNSGSKENALPFVFRVNTGNNRCDSNSNEKEEEEEEEEEQVFYVAVPIATIPSAFEMTMPSEALENIADVAKDFYKKMAAKAPSSTSLNFKPAITRVSVVKKSVVKNSNINVTHVHLSPLTGRRHQLRLHMLAAFGRPILGDFTYTPKDDETVERAEWPRMCLHARSLTVDTDEKLISAQVQAQGFPDC